MNTNKIKELYTYALPVVGMYELMYTQVINPNTKKTAFQEFAHTCELATWKTNFIPAPNNDTTYSRAWLDLRKGPIIIETPDTNDRFYSIQLLDMNSETILNLGKRLHGTLPHKFAIMHKSWSGELPLDVIPVKCQTWFVIAFLRVLIGSSQELLEVRNIQNSFVFKSPYNTDNIPISTFPKYNNSNFKEFFRTAEEVLNLSTTEDFHANYKKDISDLSALSEDELVEGCTQAIKDIEAGGLKFGEQVNNWRICRVGIGTYGDNYFQRSVIWYKGAMANVPEESLYPSTFQDKEGNLLDGNNNYSLTFKKDEMPPVSQFWSITMYKFSDALLIKNPIDRYSIGDRSRDLHYNEDGSLTIYLQNTQPSLPHEQTNWLPAPAEKFYITLRLYGPDLSAIDGTWTPPFVIKI